MTQTSQATTDTSSPLRALKRRALTLGAAKSFEYATQFLLPIVLVRCLTTEDFGQYRLLWLTVMTIIAVAPLAMPQSLYYFLPRSDAAGKRLYTHQTLLYMTFVGLVGGWAISAWSPLHLHAIDTLGRFGLLVPCLVLFLAMSSLLDTLPTIEERIVWQVASTIALSLLRTVSLAMAAYLTADLTVLIWLLVALAVLKLLLLLRYLASSQGLMGPWLRWSSFVGQFHHAVPFGLSSGLFALRSQSDQWVVASLFSVHSFAAFSIAAVLGPLVNLFRLSINHTFLPSMSRLQASGDIAGMLELNSRANVMVGRMVFPLLAFAFVFAEEMVTVVYTANYLEAAAVMRVYMFSLLAMVVELFSITLLLKEGVFALRLNIFLLGLSVALSWLGATWYGLPGAAAGSVIVLYLDRFATLKRIAMRVAMPLGQLQDWRPLGLLILLSALSGTLAWAVTGHYWASHGPIVRMLVGGGILAASYASLHGLFCSGREGLIANCTPKG